MVGDRHDARRNRNIDTAGVTVVDEAKIRIDVVEILGDRTIGTRLDLFTEMPQFRLGTARFRMQLRVTRNLDVKAVARVRPHEAHQVDGMIEYTVSTARWPVAAQHHQAADAGREIGLEQFLNARDIFRHARDVRCRLDPGLCLNVQRRIARPGACRTAGAESHRHITGPESDQTITAGAITLILFPVLRGEELEGQLGGINLRHVDGPSWR